LSVRPAGPPDISKVIFIFIRIGEHGSTAENAAGRRRFRPPPRPSPETRLENAHNLLIFQRKLFAMAIDGGAIFCHTPFNWAANGAQARGHARDNFSHHAPARRKRRLSETT
jgi:hypothetical protein